MTTFTDDEFTQAVESDTGIKPNWLPESFVDADDGLRPSVRRIQASPFVTKHVWTRGFIFDVKTGKLTEFVLSREVMNGEAADKTRTRKRRRVWACDLVCPVYAVAAPRASPPCAN